jgi:hypothetical protein
MFTAEPNRPLVYVYMFPIIIEYFLYFDLRLIVITSCSIVAINVAKIVYYMAFLGLTDSFSTTNYLIQFASVFLFAFALIVSTRLSNQFNNEKISSIERERQKVYYTNFTDEILSVKEGESLNMTNNLKDYKKKVEYYLNEHRDIMAVYKLRNNKKLSMADLKELEHILWQDLGTKNDYEKEYGDTPISKLVRRIVGLTDRL